MSHKISQQPNTDLTCVVPMAGLALLTTAIDITTLWAWSNDSVPGYVGLLIHLFTSLLFLLFSFWLHRIKRSRLLASIAFPIVLVMGPVGSLGMLLTSLLYVWYRKRSTPFEVWYREILPEQTTPPEEHLIERLRIWGEEIKIQQHEPIPFVDVLATGSRAEKQSAITLIQRNFHPSFAPALKEALNDKDNAVRVQAASIITKMEEEFLANTLLLESRKESHPDDYENLIKLARHYDDYALAGLSSAETLVEYRQEAEKSYQQLLELRSNDPLLLWLWGRLLVRSERSDEATEIFEKALEITEDVADPLHRVWYWECLFNQSKYSKLREQIKRHFEQIPRDAVLPQAILDSIDLWIINDIQKELV